MSINLVLHLTGLCTFVPRYKITDKQRYGHNRVKILLADTSEPPDIPHQHDAYTYENHLPVFVCPSYNIDTQKGRQADEVFEGMSVFYLDDQDLWIPGPKVDNLEIKYKNITGCSKLEDGDDSFAWVAPLAKICPGSEVVHPDCLSRKSVDSSVLARVELNDGYLETYLMAMDGDKQIVNWKFQLPDGKAAITHRQSVADIVQFKKTYAGSSLILKTRLFRTSMNRRVRSIFSKVGQELPIYVIPRREGEHVNARIENMPWLDILRTRTLPPGPRKPEVHFAHFYKMSARYGDANVPYQAAQCGYSDGKHQGNPSCPPARAAATKWDSIIEGSGQANASESAILATVE